MKKRKFKGRQFEKVSYSDDGILPIRSDDGSAGYDFFIPKEITINPKESISICTNIKAMMQKDEVLMLYVRSSIGIKKHLMLCNGTGVIDSTYYNNPTNEGNIACALYNYGDEPVVLEAGSRVMQGIFIKYLVANNDIVLNKQRLGGIGSSGK